MSFKIKEILVDLNPKRNCNRHEDCDKAEEELLKKYPNKSKKDISVSFHCHDDECEDCFGC